VTEDQVAEANRAWVSCWGSPELVETSVQMVRDDHRAHEALARQRDQARAEHASARRAHHGWLERRARRGGTRPRAQRPRRAGASSSTSGQDPGEQGDAELPPRPALVLACPPATRWTYACLTAEQRREVVA
jgi:hypothetical protein